MGEKRQAGRRPSMHTGEGSLRRRIVEYIAQQGGELRSHCGQALQRQICDALAERPLRVSQALIALERRGLLEREMDVERHRCQAIRLVPGTSVPDPTPERRPPPGAPLEVVLDDQQAELQAAEQRLRALTREAAEVSRRVTRLRWALQQANEDQPVPSRG